MANEAFGRPYAEALLQSAPQGFDAQACLAGLSAVADALAASRDLYALLASPSVATPVKTKILDELGARAGLEDLGRRFLRLLLARGRVIQLHDIVAALRVAVDVRSGVQPARVTSANELSGAEKSSVSAALSRVTGKKVRVLFETDPRLLAGFVAHVGSRVYDASAAGAIEKFRKEAYGN